MSQREVEHLIGRLITDEAFRDEFQRDPERVLRGLVERGVTLTPAEVAALRTTRHAVWERAARDIDPRLQKVSLRSARIPRATADDPSDADDNGIE